MYTSNLTQILHKENIMLRMTHSFRLGCCLFDISTFPLSRNHVILTYYARPLQRVLTYQILRPNRVRKVLDGICAYVKCGIRGFSEEGEDYICVTCRPQAYIAKHVITLHQLMRLHAGCIVTLYIMG